MNENEITQTEDKTESNNISGGETFKLTEEQLLNDSNDTMGELIGELKKKDRKEAEEETYTENGDTESQKTETIKKDPPKEKAKKEPEPSQNTGKIGAVGRTLLKGTDMLMQFFIAWITGDFDSDEFEPTTKENKDLELLFKDAAEADPGILKWINPKIIFIAALIFTYIPKFIRAVKKRRAKKTGNTDNVKTGTHETKPAENLNNIMSRMNENLERNEIPKDESIGTNNRDEKRDEILRKFEDEKNRKQKGESPKDRRNRIRRARYDKDEALKQLKDEQ